MDFSRAIMGGSCLDYPKYEKKTYYDMQQKKLVEMSIYRDRAYIDKLGGIIMWEASSSQAMKPVKEATQSFDLSTAIVILVQKERLNNFKFALKANKLATLWKDRNKYGYCFIDDSRDMLYAIVTFSGPDTYMSRVKQMLKDKQILYVKENTCHICFTDHGKEQCRKCRYCLLDGHSIHTCKKRPLSEQEMTKIKETLPQGLKRADPTLAASTSLTKVEYHQKFKTYPPMFKTVDGEKVMITGKKRRERIQAIQRMEKSGSYAPKYQGWDPIIGKGVKDRIYGIDVEKMVASDNSQLAAEVVIVYFERISKSKNCCYSRFINNVEDCTTLNHWSPVTLPQTRNGVHFSTAKKEILEGIENGVLVTLAGKQDLLSLSIDYCDLFDHKITFIDIQLPPLVYDAGPQKLAGLKAMTKAYLDKDIQVTASHSCAEGARATLSVFLEMLKRIANDQHLLTYDNIQHFKVKSKIYKTSLESLKY